MERRIEVDMRNERVLYQFDNFRVDSGLFLLVEQGTPRPITPTVFRILLILLENAGRIVTKDELMSTIWSDSFVEEGNLNRNVSTLRKVLGETPRDHRYIETIPKTGYRFVAPVQKLEYQPVTGKAPGAQARRPVVGREEERQTLMTAFNETQEGRGSMICVSGELGIGKSTLVDGFLSDLSAGGRTFHLARARCSEPLTQPEPYGPFLECLGSIMKTDMFANAIKRHAPAWHREITAVTNDDLSAPISGGRMKREMSELLREMSVVHPVVLMIDDFHWSDVASVDLLAFLADRLASMRVLVVICMRPSELTIHKHPFIQTRAHLLGTSGMKELHLSPLSKDHIQAFIDIECQDAVGDDDFATLVLARSEGNPLFMIEVIRSIQKDKQFAKRQDAVPEALRSLIRSRLEPLDELDQILLAAASVQGHEFDSAILAKSIGMKPAEVEARLQSICETHELIRRLREEELMDGKFTVRYRFVHTLYQIVCNASLPPTRKAALNSAVAEAFLAFYG
jgi:predicted ATPase